MTNYRAVSLLFLIVVLSACKSDSVYEEDMAVGENGWIMGDVKNFEIPITDTISPLNLYINVRTTVDYPYSNIYLFLESIYPTGYTDIDTLDFILATNDGRWLGENSGTIIENQFLISSGGRFTTAGNYIFKIQHAMKDQILPAVMDVGMRVEVKK